MLKHKEDYLRYKQTYTIKAFNRYEPWLRKFENFIGEKDEGGVSEQDIFHFKTSLENDYAPQSVEYALTILKNYFYYLKLKNISCFNPDLIKRPKSRANSHQAVSPEDYQKILNHIDRTFPPNELKYLQTQLIIRILGETGVRVSELTSISLDNIHLAKCGAFIENRKNTNMRWIYWSTATNEILKKYLPTREQLKRNTRALFVGSQINGEALTTRSIQRIVKNCCRGAGIKKFSPHSFRHGLAHNVLERGGTVADVQKMLGHRSPLSSMKYLQYSDVEHERRAKKFLEMV